MIALKLPLTILVSSFLLGAGVALVIPASSSAGNNPCNNNCYMDFNCGGYPSGAPVSGAYTCPEGYVASYRCYASALLVCDPWMDPSDTIAVACRPAADCRADLTAT